MIVIINAIIVVVVTRKDEKIPNTNTTIPSAPPPHTNLLP